MKLEMNLSRDFVESLTEQITGQIDVDYSDLAENISLSELAGEIDTRDLAGEIDLGELAGELNVAEIVSELDHEQFHSSVAEHVDEEAVAGHLDLNAISKHIDLEKLSEHLLMSVVEYLSPDKVGELIKRGSLFDNLKMQEQLMTLKLRQEQHERKIQEALSEFQQALNILVSKLKSE